MGVLFHASLTFLIVSVLMGVLSAGLVVPAAGLAGVGSRSAANSLARLPQDLATPAPSERSVLLANDGSVLAQFYDENRRAVPLERIAPVMRRAQVAIEDHRFYQHGALDVQGTLRALVQNSAGGETQGGSTITQQYVKLVQLERANARGDTAAFEAAQERTYARKIKEMRHAIALEKRWTKDEILERYLNIAYFGDGVYGVEQAARHYFRTTAADLDLAEAALLAGLVRNPTATDPVRRPGAAAARRDVVINRMLELGLVTASEARRAKDTPWNPKDVKAQRSGCLGTEFPFLCDYVRRTLLEHPALGHTREARQSRLQRGGLTIKTMIDKDSQRKAEHAVGAVIGPKDPVISTMSMIEPGTGKITAMAQSRPVMGEGPGETFYNYAASQALGGAEGFQAGSTFKTFSAAAALAEGLSVRQRYDSPSRMDFGNTLFDSCRGPVRVPEGYRPKNSTRSGSNMTMAYAMDWSVNTYFLQLGRDTGMCQVATMMDKMGVRPAGGETLADHSDIFSLPLGTVDVAPLSMTEAYATLAADGVHCRPVIVDSITTSRGKTLAAPRPDCERVMRKDVARQVTQLLKSVMQGTGAPAALHNNHDVAGKTGATDNSEATWFCGYSPELAGCSSIAVDKSSDHWDGGQRSLTGLQLPRGGWLSGDGGGDAGARIWKPVMLEALKGKDSTRFKKPQPAIGDGAHGRKTR